MGQALDRDGNILGEADGETRTDVLKKLEAAHKEAFEIRIRQKLEELNQRVGTCGDTPITAAEFRTAMAEDETPDAVDPVPGIVAPGERATPESSSSKIVASPLQGPTPQEAHEENLSRLPVVPGSEQPSTRKSPTG